MKNFFLILLVLAGGLLLAGCVKDQQQSSQNANTSGQMEQGQVRGVMFNAENFSEASIADLIVGLKVMVMGPENADKSITAERVIIGNSDTDFNTMFQRPTTTAAGSIAAPTAAPAAGTPTVRMPNGERPDMQQFQNMTEEQRAQFRERMQQQGGAVTPRRTGGASGQLQRLTGEILNLDSGSFVLKLQDGGSRLVFISDKTVVMKVKE